MKQCLLFFLLCSLFFACGNSGNEQYAGDVMVKVGDRALSREEIERQIPKGVSSIDSLMWAETLMKKWIVDALTDAAAYKNIGDDKAEIDKLVNEYRRSLIRHRYQERIVKDKVSATFSEADKMEYYEANKDQFVLSDNLIKGIFLKVPVGAPGLDNVRKWYTQGSAESVELIEKYSLQNAIIYNYFYDRWINVEEVLNIIPHDISNPTRFLKVNNHLEVSDSSFVYFLNMSDKLLIGNIAPFEYVGAQIQRMLENKQRIDYLREFGEELYRDAVKNGTVKFVADK